MIDTIETTKTGIRSVEIRYRRKHSNGPFLHCIEVGILGPYSSFTVGHQMLLMLRTSFKDHEFALYRAGMLLMESDQPGVTK